VTATEVEAVFLIADLCGYTALTEVHGNIHAAGAVTRYTEIARAVLQPAARLVERVGDEVLIVAQDAASAVRTAVALRDAVEREPLFPTLRSGIHAGSAVEQGESYFGSALNLASRVAAHARAGQILCTEPVTTLAIDLDDIGYQSLGAVRFKNIVDPVRIFEVIAGRQSSESTVIDPVCRMQVRPDAAPARLPYGGTTYYFCSFDCARAFAERPEHYVTSPPTG
jgi:class 3 adenylate cyclase/YHS domain-containing protein